MCSLFTNKLLISIDAKSINDSFYNLTDNGVNGILKCFTRITDIRNDFY